LNIKIRRRELDLDGDAYSALSELDDPSLRECLKTLTKLEYCNINQSSRLSRLVLELEEPISQELINLYVQLSGKHFADVFNPVNFRHLSKYKSLYDLSISAIHQSSSDSLTTTSFSNLPLPDLSAIDCISLFGCLTNTRADRLIKCCSPSSMVISNSDGGGGALVILEAVKTPSRLVELRLFSAGIFSSGLLLSEPKYLQSLSRYKNINHLTLDHGSSSILPAFYDCLRRLPLEYLEFGSDTEVSSSNLLTLLESPSSVKTLQRLVLGNIVASRGSYIHASDDHDWELPDWTDDFDLDGTDLVIQAAESAGVKVTGTTIDAYKIELDFASLVMAVEGDEGCGGGEAPDGSDESDEETGDESEGVGVEN